MKQENSTTQLYSNFISMIDQSKNGNLYEQLVDAARGAFNYSPQPRRMFAVETAIEFHRMAGEAQKKEELSAEDFSGNREAISAYWALISACLIHAEDKNFFSEMKQAAENCKPATAEGAAINKAATRVFEALGK